MTLASETVQQALRNLHSLPVDASLGLLFPGQGSQKVGMGEEAARSPEIASIYATADEVLGGRLSALCFQGPEEELTRTVNAQPALLLTSVAGTVAALRGGGLASRPAYLAGHSLGEYSALVIAGALAFEDALLLVRERGRLMEEAGREQPGTMAALVGIDDEAATTICREAGAEMANYNSPTQFVIGGKREAIEAACALAKERGGRGLPVAVSGAFHTSLMADAARRFQPALDAVTIGDPSIPVIANVRARPMTTAGEVRRELREQILSPVMWHQSVRAMMQPGVSRFREAPPGRVLTAMLKRSDPELELLPLESAPVGSNV